MMTPDPSFPLANMHEMAHQKGFQEDEANFVGYLACKYHRTMIFNTLILSRFSTL